MEQQEQAPVESSATQDDRNLGLLLWLTSIFFIVIPGLAYYLLKQDNPYLLAQSKEALNWSITAVAGYVAGMILVVFLVGILVIFAVAIVHVVFCIMGAVATYNGREFRVPFAIRLIK